jgi:hypothetical protein
MPNSSRFSFLVVIPLLVSSLFLGPADAAQYVFEPPSDDDDGQLVDGFAWDPRLSSSTIPDLLLNLGQEGSSTYDVAVGFATPALAEGQSLSDVRLRLGEQGSVIGSGLVVQITGALSIDPLATSGAARFSLPRTSASVIWSITAPWDSSGQRIVKYEETPDLSPVLNEILSLNGWDTGAKEVLLFLEVISAIGDNVVRFDDTHGAYWNGGNAGIDPPLLRVSETFRDAFWGKEMLCRPKPTSMQVNVIPHRNAEAYIEWGTDGVTFPNVTSVSFIAAEAAKEFTMTGLSPDSEYFYRLRCRPAGGGTYETGPTRSFLTLPAAGQQARLCVTTDIHVTNQLALGLDGSMALLEQTIDYMAGYLGPERYHMWLDLGDLVVMRAQRIIFDLEEAEQRFRTARAYVDRAAHSLPFVFVRGNHEEVNGWDYDGTAENTMIWAGKMLLKYCAPPRPDDYYDGNDVSYPDLGVPGDYFAFDVGNLRIRALDPYLFSLTRPHNGHGEINGSLNGWDWTLGDQQYLWLHDDLVDHQTPFSLVAIHHLTSCYDEPGAYYGRGGIEVAKFSVDGRTSFEWGGEDSTGAYVLPAMRPNFVHGAPHDMLVTLGNQVVLKGHEHFHARQTLDGMVYLTMSKPDDNGEQTGDLWGWRFSAHYPEPVTLAETNSGFYSILVEDSSATYSYVQTYPTDGLGTVRDSFTILPGSAPGLGVPSLGGEFTKTWIRNVRPNPGRAGGDTEILWDLGREGFVRLVLYDAAGRRVRELESGRFPAGAHSSTWDGRDSSGRRVASGVYFGKLEAEDRVDAVKVIVLR